MFQHGRLVRPFLCGPRAAGRPPADFRLIRRQKGCVPSRARLSPSCVLYPDMVYGFPTGRTLMGRSTLSSVRSLHSRPLSFPFRRRGILSHVSTYQGRSVRYCHTFQRPGHIRRYVTSRDRRMPGQKKRSLRALSHFFAFSRDAIAASPEMLCVSSFSRARKGRFARACRSFSRYKAHKMPFHAILLQCSN